MKLLYTLIILFAFSFLSASKWVATEHYDELTLEKWMTLSLVSDEAVYFRNSYVNAELIIQGNARVSEGMWTDVAIDWKGYIGNDLPMVSYRIDNNELVERKWSSGYNKDITLHMLKYKLVNELMGNNKATFRVRPYSHSPITQSFTLNGLDSLLNQYRDYFPDVMNPNYVKQILEERELIRKETKRNKDWEDTMPLMRYTAVYILLIFSLLIVLAP